MELWIRSQDRKVLTQVKELYVTTYSEEKGYGIYDLPDEVDDTDVPLGFYKSKERALEVLDEIQEAINNKGIYEWETDYYEENGISHFHTNVKTVYEMPKE